MIKDRNSKNLTEAEDIKSWQEYSGLYKKGLSDPDKPQWYDHSSRARHPGLQGQLGLRKHYYEQSQWR